MDNGAIRQEAERILADPDFQQYREREEMFDLMRWLRENLSLPEFPTFNVKGDPVIWSLVWKALQVLGFLVLFLVVGFALYKLYCWLAKRPADRPDTYGITEQQRQQAQESYAKLSADALAVQDYRQAMHYLFLAAVTQVIRDALFHGAHTLTNRELARASDFSRFSDPQGMSRLFHEMVYYDEPRWFGTWPASLQEYEHFEQLYRQFAVGLMPRSASTSITSEAARHA